MTYGLCFVDVDVVLAGCAGSGAPPVDSNEAPTEDKPPFGSELLPVELEPSELDVPDVAGEFVIDDMPLMR